MFLEERFVRLTDRLRVHGTLPLRLQLWNGRQFDLAPVPTVTVTIPKPSALRWFLRTDLNKLGEAFVEGHIDVQGSIHDVFRVAENLARSVAAPGHHRHHFLRRHSRARDQHAIQYHYDVSNDFYALFLDTNMVYSCAYFKSESDALDTAQTQKLDHILTKLMLKPGEQFLDVGCGWGALIIRAAQRFGAIATGITLSRNQHDYATNRIRELGLEDRCRVQLLDYRDLPGDGVYDKIASVGMFEHVGLKNLSVYFAKLHSLLKDDGLLLNHGITTSDPASGSMRLGAGEFIDRYVFPDGELPHLALVLSEMAHTGWETTDVESLRRHYARTCRAWTDRLEANRSRAIELAGEKRARIWQIYLAGCAYGFAQGWMNLYQILACKSANAAARPLPLTRDYMYEAARSL
jgi:cyclopropane-fatty-acyl-phospholipid synthase